MEANSPKTIMFPSPSTVSPWGCHSSHRDYFCTPPTVHQTLCNRLTCPLSAFPTTSQAFCSTHFWNTPSDSCPFKCIPWGRGEAPQICAPEIGLQFPDRQVKFCFVVVRGVGLGHERPRGSLCIGVQGGREVRCASRVVLPQDWRTVPEVSLFTADTKKVESNRRARIVQHLRDEAKGCRYLVLWLDCDREGENICFEVCARMCVGARSQLMTL